jgi:hypothetical protein
MGNTAIYYMSKMMIEPLFFWKRFRQEYLFAYRLAKAFAFNDE